MDTHNSFDTFNTLLSWLCTNNNKKMPTKQTSIGHAALPPIVRAIDAEAVKAIDTNARSEEW